MSLATSIVAPPLLTAFLKPVSQPPAGLHPIDQ